MNLFGILTLLFVLLKVFGVITWSWWLVFSPLIIVVALCVLWFTFGIGFISFFFRK